MTTQQLHPPAPSRHIVRNVLAFAAGLAAAVLLSALLARTDAPLWWPEVLIPVALIVAALRRGTVRWAFAGLAVGVLAIAAFTLYVLNAFGQDLAGL